MIGATDPPGGDDGLLIHHLVYQNPITQPSSRDSDADKDEDDDDDNDKNKDDDNDFKKKVNYEYKVITKKISKNKVVVRDNDNNEKKS